MTDWMAQSVTVPREDEILDIRGVAAELNITVTELRTLRDRTWKRTERGQDIRAEDFPLPDGRIGRDPWWYRTTITRYKRASTEGNR